jgi:hypothetical protein
VRGALTWLAGAWSGLWALAGLAAGPGQPAEGVYLEQEVTRLALADEPVLQGLQRVWLAPGRVRQELEFDGRRTLSLFDLEAGTVALAIDPGKKIARLSLEEYRRLVVMILKDAGFLEKGPSPTVERMPESRQVGEWLAWRHVYRQRGRLAVDMELWIAKDLGPGMEEYLALLAGLELSGPFGHLPEAMARLDGYPVETRTEQTLEGQRVVSVVRLLKLTRGPIDPQLFQAPEGYRKVSFESL